MADAPRQPAGERPQQTPARHPPQYTLKDTFATWFKQFRNYAELLNIPQNQLYRTMLSFLDGETFVTVENLQLTEEQKGDIYANEVQNLLKNALKSHGNRVRPEYEFLHRTQKPDETIEKYAAELEKLALETFPNEQNIRQNRSLIMAFIGGIRNDELGIKLLQAEYNNLGEALTAASQYLQALQTRRFIKTEKEHKPILEKIYSVQELRETTPDSITEEHVINAIRPRTQQPGPNQKPTPPAPILQPPPTMPAYNQIQQPNPQWWQMPQFINSPHQNWNPAQFNMPAPSFNPRQNYPQGSNQPYGMNNTGYNTQKGKNACHYCLRPGHYKKDCFKLKRDMQQSNTSQQAYNTQTQQYCTRCNMNNHATENCGILRREQAQQNNYCTKCNMYNHTTENCRAQNTGMTSNNPFLPPPAQ